MSSPKPLAAKASPSSASGMAPVKLSISKSYVIPPRPKPGRKPAIDPPPNKRKAQNREAQRAFRERRSNAVRELEDKLAVQAAQNAAQQAQLQAQILALQQQINQGQLTPPQSMYTNSPGFSPGSWQSETSPMSSANSPGSATSPLTPDPALALLDTVLDQKLPEPKRARRESIGATSPRVHANYSKHTPVPPAVGIDLVNLDWSRPAVPLRRQRLALETDFTTSFKSKNQAVRPLPLLLHISEDAPTPSSRCGFCTDDTPCVCAAAAACRGANLSDVGSPLSETLPPLPYLNSSSAASPPKRTGAEADVDICTGNPGSCPSCKRDPMLTLFCATLSSRPACAISGGTYIPAKAAYRTLSRHPKFGEFNFETLVTSLTANGAQIEVNSIAKVLRMMD